MSAVQMIEHHQNLRLDEIEKNKEGLRVIWLGENVNDSLEIQIKLLELNPAALFYTEVNRCIDLMKTIKDEHVLLILWESFVPTILPQIHELRSIGGIFIFCNQREPYALFKDKYEKIIEIYVDQDSLLGSLRETINLAEKRIIVFSLFDQKQKSSRDLSKESAAFLWHQMLLYVLKQMPHDEQAKQDMLNKCEDYYRFNKDELRKIDEFRKTYHHERAIEWYTDQCFLYKLLNQALRTEDIELLYSFRFFIIDLCSDIERMRLSNETIFKVYRGQTIPVEEFEKLKTNIGTIISTNGFLSTSQERDIAVEFAQQGNTSNDRRSVLLEIEVDLSMKSVVCADITDRSLMGYTKDRRISLKCSTTRHRLFSNHLFRSSSPQSIRSN